MRKLLVMAMLSACTSNSPAEDPHTLSACVGWPDNGGTVQRECEQACANFEDNVEFVRCSAHRSDGQAVQCGGDQDAGGITWMGEKGCCTAVLSEQTVHFASCDDQ